MPLETPRETGPLSPSQMREVVFLAEQAADSGMKVLPGNSWALHYPENGARRAERLQGLLDGRYEPKDVAQDLKPDSLLFDTKDIQKLGMDGMTSRIRELTSTAAHADYERFAEFVAGMQGKQVDLSTLQSLYDGVAQSRTRSTLLESFGSNGRRQLTSALQNEARVTSEHFRSLRGMDRVLQALKMRWMERRGIASLEQAAATVDALNAREREVFDQCADAYAEYADRGGSASFEKLSRRIREELPIIEKIEAQQSPEMEKLRDELQEFMEQAVYPGSPGDTAIPPDDQDECHTQPPEQNESGEKGPSASIFEITPSGSSTAAAVGYYASGRKSYYDTLNKTWNKRKRLSPYHTAVQGDKRQTISGHVSGEVKSLPIPVGHCLDASSLTWKGEKPNLLRDQKGCFYVQPTGSCSFSVDFLKEDIPFGESPIPEDLEPLTPLPLSSEAENMIASLQGNPMERATRITRYVHGGHFYPGGGDLKIAQALQHKLRTESSSDEYLSALERSEYLECYSSNTLFVAYCRRAGIPARLVVGHKIDGARDGKAAITESTGHAWSEFWDGAAWRRIDATPPAKPEDKKREEKQDPGEATPSEEADDGGIDESPDQDLTDTMRDRVDEQMKQVKNQAGHAQSDEIKEAESALDEAKKTVERIRERQRDLQDRAKNAKSFVKLEEIGQESDASDLPDDMKQSIEKTCKAREEQMKNELRDRIDDMKKDGFYDPETAEDMKQQLEEGSAKERDGLMKVLEREQKEFLEYDELRTEVMPLVKHWYRYFAKHLPRQSEMETDETSLGKRGSWNRRAAMRPGNILFNKLRNPRDMRSSIKPRFIASILVDVSGSMEGDKLKNAKKLLVFFCELFSLISEEFGYIRFNINTFSDSINEIKGYDHKYGSPERYEYADGSSSTVKVRLMRSVKATGGTNMLDALKKVSTDLNEQKHDYKDHASAFYFIGDGGDTCGNKANIQQFLAADRKNNGFGRNHMRSAVLLGTEEERQELSELFGEKNTTVAGDFETLIKKSMNRFANEIETYCKPMKTA